MGFIAETRWLAPQKQSILSWVRKHRVGGALAQQSRDMRGGSAPTGCGSNLRAQIRAMLVVRTRLRFMRTGIADLGLLRGMIHQQGRLRSMHILTD